MSGPVPKSTIAAIHPYVAGKAKAAGFAKPIKLSANENGLGCSRAARFAYAEVADKLHLYPDPAANSLRSAIADKYQLEPSRIVFGTGSDELFSLACQAYLSPGDNIVQPQYAFAAWAIAARAAGADVKSAQERNFTVDVDAMLTAVDARTRIVFVANPASPTGTSIPYAEIERLHAGLPENVLLILDGAYAEFALDRPGYAEGLALARTAPNVLATRTFSKIYGLASLRLGWGYSSAVIAETLNKIRLPFNGSAPALAAAEAALADNSFTQLSAAHAARHRVALFDLAGKLGLDPTPPSSNFVTIGVPKSSPLDARGLEEGLASAGIIVRGLSSYAMPDHLRISIGTDEDMARLEAELRRLFAT